MSDDPPSERRREYIDLTAAYRELTQIVHNHDTEIAVLRTQMQSDSGRLSMLEKAVEKIFERLDDMKDLLSAGRDLLAEHMQQEDHDRQRLLLGVIATLVSVLLSAGGFFVVELLHR